jgi:hypothetical protein
MLRPKKIITHLPNKYNKSLKNRLKSKSFGENEELWECCLEGFALGRMHFYYFICHPDKKESAASKSGAADVLSLHFE